MPPAVVDVIAAMLRNDVDPARFEQAALSRGALPRMGVFGEVSPARPRCSCVLARTVNGPVLIKRWNWIAVTPAGPFS